MPIKIKRSHIFSKNGGRINDKPGRSAKYIYVKIKSSDIKPDRVPSILQAGEIVIPIKHVKKVSKLLKKNHIKLPGVN